MKTMFRNLQPRERLIVGIGGLCLSAVALLELMVIPAADRLKRLDHQLKRAEDTLLEMRLLSREAASVKGRTQAVERNLKQRRRDFSLFATLEALAARTGVKENIAHMKPSEEEVEDSPYRLSRVEVRLQGIHLRQFREYLHGIEYAGQAITVRRLSAEKGKRDKDLLDVVMQIETLIL
jgi:hypothetical protein